MADDAPHIVGLLVGLFFIMIGGYAQSRNGPLPQEVGFTFAVFGGLVILTGWYVRRSTPDPITFGTDEHVLTSVEPHQLIATLKLGIGVVVLLCAGYLLFSTQVLLIYPTVIFVVGFWILLSGLVRYWKNTLTVHYVTEKRIISEYRFISLDRQIMQISDIVGVNHTQSVLESLVGYGSVLVSSGGGNPSANEVLFRNIANPREAVKSLQEAQENAGIQ